MTSAYDVIIVGAGPVGLFLACELALAEVSVLVLEREEKAESRWKELPLGLRGLNVPSVEAFYRRGLLYKIFNEAERPKYFKAQEARFAGHFAGMMLNGSKIDFSRWKYYLPGPSGFGGPTTRGHVEAVLAERAQALGAEIRRGTGVSRFLDEGQTVRVWTGDEELTAQWLVGCDGGRSSVRKAAGFDFVGTEGDFIGYIGEVELDRPELLKPGFTRTETGMYMKPAPNAVYVIDFVLGFDSRSQEVTREHFQDALRRVSGTDVGVKALHLATSFTDRSKQVTQYRKGRILLAGDSAHIHSPLGAQGLNAGLGDAMNLGWKLAATVRGNSPAGLLDSYHSERHPVAAWVLEWTRAQSATLQLNPYAQAVGNVIRDMINTVDGTTYFVERIWGLSLRYDLGSGDAHVLVGCSAPDFDFDDGSRLGPKLAKGGFWVVDFEDDPSLARFAKDLEPHVHYHGVRAKETFGLKALLLRPDGVVVSVADDKVDVDAFRAVLSRWLSIPEPET